MLNEIKMVSELKRSHIFITIQFHTKQKQKKGRKKKYVFVSIFDALEFLPASKNIKVRRTEETEKRKQEWKIKAAALSEMHDWNNFVHKMRQKWNEEKSVLKKWFFHDQNDDDGKKDCPQLAFTYLEFCLMIFLFSFPRFFDNENNLIEFNKIVQMPVSSFSECHSL